MPVDVEERGRLPSLRPPATHLKTHYGEVVFTSLNDTWFSNANAQRTSPDQTVRARPSWRLCHPLCVAMHPATHNHAPVASSVGGSAVLTLGKLCVSATHIRHRVCLSTLQSGSPTSIWEPDRANVPDKAPAHPMTKGSRSGSGTNDLSSTLLCSFRSTHGPRPRPLRSPCLGRCV